MSLTICKIWLLCIPNGKSGMGLDIELGRDFLSSLPQVSGVGWLFQVVPLPYCSVLLFTLQLGLSWGCCWLDPLDFASNYSPNWLYVTCSPPHSPSNISLPITKAWGGEWCYCLQKSCITIKMSVFMGIILLDSLTYPFIRL